VACTGNRNYTKAIGKDLGIEFPLSDTVGLQTNMHLTWSSAPAEMKNLINETRETKTAA
jgi:hypothetical protein